MPSSHRENVIGFFSAVLFGNLVISYDDSILQNAHLVMEIHSLTL